MTPRIKRSLAIALCTTSLGLATTPVAHTAPRAEDNRCTPIRLVYVKGTFSSKSDDSTHPSRMHEGKDLYNAMSNAVGANNVSGYSVSYPASVGAISPFLVAGMNIDGWGGGNEAVTFGDSVKTAVKNGTEHIAEYKRSCPNTKFVIGGYSQGASAAGTIASEIAAGKVPGVTANDVAGVLLYADPYRAAQSDFDSYSGTPGSKLYAQPMEGVMGRNLETIVGYAPNGRKDFVGWAGPRPDNFKGMQGKVMSLCHDLDPACSVPANGMLRMIADYVDKENSYPVIKDVQTFQKLQKFNHGIIKSGAIDKVMKADPSAGDAVAKAFFDAGFAPDDLLALIFAVKEVAELTTKMYKEAGVEHAATYEEFLLMLLITALPSIVQSGTSHDMIISLLSDPTLTSAIATLGPEATAVQQAAIASLQALKTYDVAMIRANELSSQAGLPKLPALSSKVALTGSSMVADVLPEVKISGSSLIDEGSSVGSSQDLSSGGSSIVGSSSKVRDWLANRGSSEGGGSSDMGISIGGSSVGNVDRDDTVTLSSNYKENVDKAIERAENGEYITSAEILGINFASAVNDISLLLAQSLGILKKMRGPEFQSVLDESRIIGQFGYHASYWDGRFKTSGVSGGSAAEKWVGEIARNVVAGKSWDYKPQGKATGEIEPDIESDIEPYSVRYYKENPQVTKQDLYENIKGYAFVIKREDTGFLKEEDRVYAYAEGTSEYKRYYSESAPTRKIGKFSMIRFPKDNFYESNVGFGDHMNVENGKMILWNEFGDRLSFTIGGDVEEFKEAVKLYNQAYAVQEDTSIPRNADDVTDPDGKWIYTGHVKSVSDRTYEEFKAPDFSDVKVDVPADQPKQTSPETTPTSPTTTAQATPKPSIPIVSSSKESTPKSSTRASKPTQPTPAQPSSSRSTPTVTQNLPKVEPMPDYSTAKAALSIATGINDQGAINIPPSAEKAIVDFSEVLEDKETIEEVKPSNSEWKATRLSDTVYGIQLPKDKAPSTISIVTNGASGKREIAIEAFVPGFNVDSLQWDAGSGDKGSATVKGPGNFNDRFSFRKYTSLKGVTSEPDKNSAGVDIVGKISVDTNTGAIALPESMPDGEYAVPILVEDNKTKTRAIIDITIIKDKDVVKVRQEPMVSRSESIVPSTPAGEGHSGNTQRSDVTSENQTPASPPPASGQNTTPTRSADEPETNVQNDSNPVTESETKGSVSVSNPSSIQQDTDESQTSQTGTNLENATDNPNIENTAVRGILASTGVSVTALAIISLLIAGLGVAVLNRRKNK